MDCSGPKLGLNKRHDLYHFNLEYLCRGNTFALLGPTNVLFCVIKQISSSLDLSPTSPPSPLPTSPSLIFNYTPSSWRRHQVWAWSEIRHHNNAGEIKDAANCPNNCQHPSSSSSSSWSTPSTAQGGNHWWLDIQPLAIDDFLSALFDSLHYSIF